MKPFDQGVVEAMFPRGARHNIAQYFPLIEAAYSAQTKNNHTLTKEDHRDLKLFLYATIRAETGNFSPSTEGVSRFNSYTFPELQPIYDRNHRLVKLKTRDVIVTSGYKYSLLDRPYQRYEEGVQKKNLGNLHYGDGQKYKGRGFIQLTGRANYRFFSGVVPGLEANPDLADDPENASKLIVAYVLLHKDRILKDLRNKDLSRARTIVNGKPKPGHTPHGLNAFINAYNLGRSQLAKSDPEPTPAASPTPTASPTPVQPTTTVELKLP